MLAAMQRAPTADDRRLSGSSLVGVAPHTPHFNLLRGYMIIDIKSRQEIIPNCKWSVGQRIDLSTVVSTKNLTGYGVIKKIEVLGNCFCLNVIHPDGSTEKYIQF